jgi:hypothetical protein
MKRETVANIAGWLLAIALHALIGIMRADDDAANEHARAWSSASSSLSEGSADAPAY